MDWLHLRIKKKDDGDAVVSFVRADGSSTFGRLGAGGFGAVHDLAHYVIESNLRLPDGFLGLLAQGRNLEDFTATGAAARLPDEAIVAECLVGQLTSVLFGKQPVNTADFNWLVAQAVAGVRPGALAPAVGDELLAELQRQLRALVERWRALPPGRMLELEMPLRQVSRGTTNGAR